MILYNEFHFLNVIIEIKYFFHNIQIYWDAPKEAHPLMSGALAVFSSCYFLVDILFKDSVILKRG